jgi:hypothetical protein
MVRYREVMLTHAELYEQAPLWAARRWLDAVKRGYQNKHGFDGDELAAHFWGVCGEMARAKAYNLYYSPTFDAFHSPDVGGVEVRTRTKHDWDLNIRPADEDGHFFTLVTVEPPVIDRFRVYEGGMFASEAKQHREWFKTYSSRRPKAYFVPQSALVGGAELLEMPPRRLFLVGEIRAEMVTGLRGKEFRG